ncbi:hypothetical protein M8C21_024087 [Ambrosia artemisiifolia]|uniref:Uncharacterized protein n=1 Tax=Ambrosia artemisiifolia TaxID=4212 RepID=A0AAD5CSN1_AMBAR|nr:hypothetical protein M8C21_024087 [Ambrosia artemisiifolia]
MALGFRWTSPANSRNSSGVKNRRILDIIGQRSHPIMVVDSHLEGLCSTLKIATFIKYGKTALARLSAVNESLKVSKSAMKKNRQASKIRDEESRYSIFKATMSNYTPIRSSEHWRIFTQLASATEILSLKIFWSILIPPAQTL